MIMPIRFHITAIALVCVCFSASIFASDSAGTDAGTMGQKFEKVEFESLDHEGFFSSKPVRLVGYFLKAQGTAINPPVAVLAHGCLGLVNDNGSIMPKFRKMAGVLHSLGMTVLLVDSFTPRGKKEICTEYPKSRSIDGETRKKDNLGALIYLRNRSDILAKNVLLVGWGNSGVLETVNEDSGDRRFSAAVAWYPACNVANQAWSFRPYAPILVLVGEKDDWNPPRECQSLAQRKVSQSASFEIQIYPETHHNFDTPNFAVRKVTNLPWGSSTVGENPQATQDAYRRVVQFSVKHLGLPPVATERASQN